MSFATPRTGIQRRSILIVLLVAIAAVFALQMTQQASAATTVVVVSGNTAAGENQPGWMFNRDPGNVTPYAFNTAAASIGTGSLNVLPIGASAADKFIGEFFMLSPLANVTTISYDFKIGGSGTASAAGQFYANVYANFASSPLTKFYDCRYNVVPVSGSTGSFTTVAFNPTVTYPVATSGSSPSPCPAIPAGMGAGATLRAFVVNVGDTSVSDVGLAGYLDKVVVALTAGTTTYDFEPACTTVCYADAVNGNDGFSGASAANAKKTIQAAINQVSVGGTVIVAAGTYPESPLIVRSLTLKSESGKAVTTIVLQPAPNYVGALTLTGLGSNITVDGFTIQGFDAVGLGYASSNVYVAPGLGTVLVKNNRIRVGNPGAGTNDDDGMGLLTETSTSSVTLSLTVENNTFEPLNAAAPRAFYINPSVDLFSFKNNKITGRFNRTALTQAKNGTVENNTITGVGPVGSRSAGFGAWGDPDPLVWGHTTFRGNTITGTRRGIGLYSVNNILIEKNVFKNNDYAIWSGDAGYTHVIATIAIHRNSITNSSAFGVHNDEPAGTINATCNWYGAANGPGPVGFGSGDKVSTGVTFSPWLTSPDLNGPCNGAVVTSTDQCKDGGWMTLFRADGTGFKNQGDCVSYIEHLS